MRAKQLCVLTAESMAKNWSVSSATVYSKAVILLLLLVHCLRRLLLCGGFVLSHLLSVLTSYSLSIILLMKSEHVAHFLILNVFLLLCGCLFSVSLPRGAVGWSFICDCGIFWSYSLTFSIHSCGLTISNV